MSLIIGVSFVEKNGCKVDYCLQCDTLLCVRVACEEI